VVSVPSSLPGRDECATPGTSLREESPASTSKDDRGSGVETAPDAGIEFRDEMNELDMPVE